MELFLHQYLLFFNIILLFILITLEEENLSTVSLIGVKLLIELFITLVHIIIWNYVSQNVPTDVSYDCIKNLVKTHILAQPIPNFRLDI